MLPGIWYDSLKKKTTKKTYDSEHLSAHSSRRDGFIIKYIFILYGCTRAIFYNYRFIIRHTNEVNERETERERNVGIKSPGYCSLCNRCCRRGMI